MKYLKSSLLILVLLPLLSFASNSKSEVSDRGGGARANGVERNEGLRDDGVYGGNGEGAVAPAVYPAGYGYPVGGYLYPGPVDPGEDEADAIYRANQHPGE